MLDPMVAGGLVVVGVILIVIQILAPGRTFTAIPGFFLAALGAIGLATKDETFTFGYGVLIAAIAGLMAALLTFKRYDMHGKDRQKGRGASMIGKTGKVTRRISPEGTSGKVRIGKTEWKARSDGPIEAGKTVEVVDMKGLYLVVVEADKDLESEDE